MDATKLPIDEVIALLASGQQGLIITWNQLARLREKNYRPEIESTIWRTVDRDGRLVTYEQPWPGRLCMNTPAPDTITPDPVPTPVPTSKLAQILDGLVKQALDRPGSPRRMPLPSGLRVDVVVFASEIPMVYLQISREKVYPSAKEWETVLAHWPHPVPAVLPRELEDKERRYLKAGWRLPDFEAAIAKS